MLSCVLATRDCDAQFVGSQHEALDSGRTVRAKISLDAALLDAIDAAKERGLSRSAFLASAAREKIMAVA